MRGAIITGVLAFLLAGLEIKEVKNLGVSAANDANSILQVTWQATPTPDVKLSGFEIELSVTYADNFTKTFTARVNDQERRQRFEVPTLRLVPNRPAAGMKRYQVTVTAKHAAQSETATAQGNL